MLVVWTWGRQRKTLELDPYRVLVMHYRTLAMFWIFQFAYGFQYELMTYAEGNWIPQPLTKEQAQTIQQSVPDSSALDINFWWRWGFFILVGVALSIPVIMAIYFQVKYH